MPFRAEGAVMFRELAIFLYVVTAGFAASGITANLYRLLTQRQKESSTRTAYYASMVIAGPNVLFQKAAEARRAKDCSLLAFWMAAAICGYWSLAIGLLIVEIALAL
jgi:transcriptional regulator of nitric oxide reductase